MIEKLAALFQDSLSIISNAVYMVFLDTLTPFLVPVINLYLVIVGIRIITGEVETSQKSLIRLFLLFPILMVLVMDYNLYVNYFVNPLLTIREYIMVGISSIGNESGVNTFKSLDSIFKSIINTVEDGFEFSWTDWNILDLVLVVGVLLLLGTLYIAIAVFYMISLVLPSLFLMAGAIPLAMYGFERTKSIAENWFRMTMTYLLFGVLASIMTIFIHHILKIAAAQISKDFDGMFFVLLASSLLTVLVRYIPEMASGIMSSMASGDSGSMSSHIGASGRAGSKSAGAMAKGAKELHAKFYK